MELITRQTLLGLPRALGLDAVVAMSPENFTFVSGAYVATAFAIRPRQVFAILPASGEPRILLCDLERSLVAHESWIKTIDTYTEFVDNPMDALARVLRDMRLDRGRIGIDGGFLPWTSFERLRQQVPSLQVVDSEQSLAVLRARKSKAETAVLQRATAATHTAIVDAMQSSRIGDR